MRALALVATCGATLVIMILINGIPPQAMTVMVAGTLLIVGLICFLVFILALIALLLPNPSYGAAPKPEETKTINQTRIVFNIPGRDPYVLPDKNQPTGKPTALLPDRGRANANW